MNKIKCFLFLFFSVFLFQVKAQTEKSNIEKVEQYILQQQKDSAKVFLSKIKDNSGYTTILEGIVNNSDLSISSYKVFIDSVTNSQSHQYGLISKFIDNSIKQPASNVFNEDYFYIKLNQISVLRDDAKTIDQSSKINEELEKYVQNLNQNKQEVIIANAYLDFHDIVLFLIQNKNEEAKALLDNNLSVAKKFNDKPLQIASLYYSCNYYMNVQNLQEYINTCESILKLEEKLPQHSQYYRGTLMNTIDAYVYKGGYENEVDALLLKLYSNPKTREDSYPFYAKYLKYLSLESERVNKIFNQFEVNNILEFGEKIKVLAKPKLNANDYYYIYYDMGEALEQHGYLKEALEYQRDAVALNKQIYSEDLSKALANFQTQQAVKEKELELEFAEKKLQLYIVIASLIGLALFFTALFLIKNKKQTKQLDKQNKQINEALNENKLLVKEIHHRVKNNFQMVSSLLDLQTRDIEDAKAKELAKEGQNRIKSMALIHQKLYQKEDGLIDFSDYLKILVNQIQSLFKDDKDVEVNIKTEALNLDVDTALPLGLIVNELLTNTFKYGLIEDKKNIINIEVDKEENGIYKMVFSDNGRGLSKGVDIKKSKSLGLKLISRLTRQLQGTLSYKYENGAVFTLTFKDLFMRKQIR